MLRTSSSPRILPGVLLCAALWGCGPSSGASSSGTGGVDAGSDGATVGSGGMTMLGTGGSSSSGGSSATGGSSSSGGSSGSGGAPSATGGASSSGGGTAIGSGGATGGGGGTSSAGGGGAGGKGGATSRGGAPGQGGAGGRASSGGATGNITLWLAGDSTVANGTTPCPVGWGKLFMPFFNGKVTVKNSAVGGTSLHTWLYTVGTTKDATGECTLTTDATGAPVVQAHWQDMLDHMKTGDYLFIQFGINDGGDCPRYEGDAQFQKSLGMMAMAAKARGANPVFVTPVSSISCKGAAAVGTRGRFVTDTKTAGTTYGVPVIDLEALSVALYTASGFCPLPGGATDVSASTGGAVGAFFCDDHTHFETSGAMSIAKTMADAVRAQLPALASYLN